MKVIKHEIDNPTLSQILDDQIRYRRNVTAAATCGATQVADVHDATWMRLGVFVEFQEVLEITPSNVYKKPVYIMRGKMLPLQDVLECGTQTAFESLKASQEYKSIMYFTRMMGDEIRLTWEVNLLQGARDWAA